MLAKRIRARPLGLPQAAGPRDRSLSAAVGNKGAPQAWGLRRSDRTRIGRVSPREERLYSACRLLQDHSLVLSSAGNTASPWRAPVASRFLPASGSCP